MESFHKISDDPVRPFCLISHSHDQDEIVMHDLRICNFIYGLANFLFIWQNCRGEGRVDREDPEFLIAVMVSSLIIFSLERANERRIQCLAAGS